MCSSVPCAFGMRRSVGLRSAGLAGPDRALERPTGLFR